MKKLAITLLVSMAVFVVLMGVPVDPVIDTVVYVGLAGLVCLIFTCVEELLK